jgi:D-sedoheptulose 7-phosphate isomerase
MAIENIETLVEDGIRTSIAAQERLLEPEYVAAIVRAAELISESLRVGGKLLIFGNGGSAADAQHIAAEFLGRYLLERRALPALSLSDNTSTVTAIGNDYGFADVFSRQIEGLGKRGDVALAISTSGNSDNVVDAVATARELGLRTIALTGTPGGRLRDAVELCIAVPSDETPRIQECHTLVAHLICELVERDVTRDG